MDYKPIIEDVTLVRNILTKTPIASLQSSKTAAFHANSFLDTKEKYHLIRIKTIMQQNLDLTDYHKSVLIIISQYV